jgi:DNA-binding winged helix-turn-helix (wHTH) protein
MDASGKKIFRFGIFEVDTSSGELRRAGMRLRLQEQPFQVLILFLERPGEVITREEIRQKLWPSGIFVDFDHSLNTIINKIREALSDSAANPKFIETLAKRGYRFMVPVSSTSQSKPDENIEQPKRNLFPQKSSSASEFKLTSLEDLPVVQSGYLRTLFILIQLMLLVFYIVALGRVVDLQDVVDRIFGGHPAIVVVAILSASIGIPVRLFLLSAAWFDIKDLSRKFTRLFPLILILDALWALSPFLLIRKLGSGLALGITAALMYVPFAQRTLALMLERTKRSRQTEHPIITS